MTYAPNVLLLDQDHVLRKATAMLLANRGASVTLAATVEEAVALSQKRIYDVALIELAPEMPSAAEILCRLRRDGLVPRRIVLCTGTPLGPEAMGDFSEVLLKPYPFDCLLDAIFGQGGSRRPTRSGIFPQIAGREARARRARQAGVSQRALRSSRRAGRAQPRLG